MSENSQDIYSSYRKRRSKEIIRKQHRIENRSLRKSRKRNRHHSSKPHKAIHSQPDTRVVRKRSPKAYLAYYEHEYPDLIYWFREQNKKKKRFLAEKHHSQHGKSVQEHNAYRSRKHRKLHLKLKRCRRRKRSKRRECRGEAKKERLIEAKRKSIAWQRSVQVNKIIGRCLSEVKSGIFKREFSFNTLHDSLAAFNLTPDNMHNNHAQLLYHYKLYWLHADPRCVKTFTVALRLFYPRDCQDVLSRVYYVHIVPYLRETSLRNILRYYLKTQSCAYIKIYVPVNEIDNGKLRRSN